MKVTTNYGLDGKMTVNYGTKDLPICIEATALPSEQSERQPRKEVLNHGKEKEES